MPVIRVRLLPALGENLRWNERPGLPREGRPAGDSRSTVKAETRRVVFGSASRTRVAFTARGRAWRPMARKYFGSR
jgi:hypothetical protein